MSGIHRGGSGISGKGVHIYRGVGVCFADFISFFLNIPWKEIIWSQWDQNFIFIGYLKTGGREDTYLNPLWIRRWYKVKHWICSFPTTTCQLDQEMGQSKITDQPMAPWERGIRIHNVAGNFCVCFLIWGRESDIPQQAEETLSYRVNVFFRPENVVCLLRLLHLFKWTPEHFYNGSQLWTLIRLLLKAPFTAATDNKFYDIFLDFWGKYCMIFHGNRPLITSWKSSLIL